jgi:uncharacterized membrane protein YkoI
MIKNLFKTPKQAIFSVFCTLALLVMIGLGTAYSVHAVAENTSIGADKAALFAFADAGIDPAAMQNVEAKFCFERGQFVYDVEFVFEGTEYEYWIHASDGTVVKKNIDAKNAGIQTGAAAAPAEDKPAAEKPATEGGIKIPGNTFVNAIHTEAQPPKEGDQRNSESFIGVEKAKTIALNDAGLEAAAVTFTEAKLDIDDLIKHYDVEFYSSANKYDYEINAATGVIVEKSVEAIKTPAQSANTQAPVAPANDAKTDIGLDKAKTIALNDAGLAAAAVTFTEARQDFDDMIKHYDIEFFTAENKYDYEINAATGAIIEKSVEAIKAPVQSTNPKTPAAPANEAKTYIGVDKAKSIALTHAGLSAGSVSFSKAKLDDDDGRIIYEIEFYVGNTEYDYEIDAYTGSIIEFDIDRD